VTGGSREWTYSRQSVGQTGSQAYAEFSDERHTVGAASQNNRVGFHDLTVPRLNATCLAVHGSKGYDFCGGLKFRTVTLGSS